MAAYELTFNTVSIPADSGGITVTLYEDEGNDGSGSNTDPNGKSYDNADTVALSDGTGSYTTADVFNGASGDAVWAQIDEGPPTDVAVTSSVTVDLTIESSASAQTINASAETEVAQEPAVSIQIGDTIGASVEGLAIGEPDILADAPVTISPTVETLAAQGHGISLAYDQFPTPSAVTLTAQELSPELGLTIGATVETLTTTAPSPGVRVAGAQTLTASSAALSAGGPRVSLSLEDWTIDNDNVGTTGQGQLEIVDFRIQHDRITLSWVATLSRLDDLRQFAPDAGELQRVVDSEGDWTTLDDSGRDNIYQIKPPVSLKPPLDDAVYLVERYSEQSRTAGHVKDVDIEFVRRNARSESNVLSQSASADEWAFAFSSGTIATETVQRADEGNQDDQGFTMQLTPEQAEVILTGPTKLGAVAVESVPNGNDFVRDNNANDANTVTITSPSSLGSDWFDEDGTYVVRQWELTHYALDVYELTLVARKI